MKYVKGFIRIYIAFLFFAPIVMLFFINEISIFIYPFAEKYISPDQNIENGIEALSQVLLFIIIICILFSLISLILFRNNVFDKFKTFLFNHSLKQFFFSEDTLLDSTFYKAKNGLMIASL